MKSKILLQSPIILLIDGGIRIEIGHNMQESCNWSWQEFHSRKRKALEENFVFFGNYPQIGHFSPFRNFVLILTEVFGRLDWAAQSKIRFCECKEPPHPHFIDKISQKFSFSSSRAVLMLLLVLLIIINIIITNKVVIGPDKSLVVPHCFLYFCKLLSSDHKMNSMKMIIKPIMMM